jgi:GT2 family glycosyltransferase
MPINLIVPTLDPLAGAKALSHAKRNAGVPVEPLLIVDEVKAGFTRTVNRGLSHLKGDTCIVVDDCCFTYGWLETLHEVLHSREKIGFVGPSGPCRTAPQNGGEPHDTGKPQYVSHLAGFCLLIHGGVLRDFGILDERYKHYGSDVDYQWRARAQGWRSVWVPNVYVWHELHEPIEPWWFEDNAVFEQEWR